MCKLYFIQLKTIKSNAFNNDFLKKAASFHNTSKVHILLFSDLVTVTKLPPNLSKSTVEKTDVQSVKEVIHFKVVSQNTLEVDIVMCNVVLLHVLYITTDL